MWVFRVGQDGPENIFIPEDAPSSNGEFDDMRQEVSYYWHAVEEYLATGDTSELDRFAGSHVEIDGRVHFFNRDMFSLEDAADRGEMGFDDIESGGGE